MIAGQGGRRALLGRLVRPAHAGGNRGRPGRLGGGVVDLEASVGQATEGDDEDEQEQQQRGEQGQLRGHAAPIVAVDFSSHGPLTKRSIGPDDVALTARCNSGMIPSALPVTVTAAVVAPRLTETTGLIRTLRPTLESSDSASLRPEVVVPPSTLVAAKAWAAEVWATSLACS